MKGAIIGDIVGSVYEWDNIKTKDFPLFSEKSFFTDDTVCTVAVGSAFLDSWEQEDGTENLYAKDYNEVFYYHVKQALYTYGNKYRGRGYGGAFKHWLHTPAMSTSGVYHSDVLHPYVSWGNGAPMRCSAAGWVTDDFRTALALGVMTAMPTHNHPEALKAAGLVAELISEARNGLPMSDLLDRAEEFYSLPDLSYIRPTYRFDVSCMGTMPVALSAFFESTDFEDAIRNAISVGGDSDTIACITGSLAEAYYGVPDHLWEKAKTYLTAELIDVVESFHEKFGD